MEAGGAIETEFPGLRLRTVRLAVAEPVVRRAPRDLRDRLAELSNRFRGAQAVAVRRDPIASAHRIFFRHVGVDPDVQRVPVEEAVVERLVLGAFPSRSLLDDARLIALIETGIAVWAVDGTTVHGTLELAAEPDGRLVVADARGTLAPLFEAPPRERLPHKGTRSLVLYALQVPGVADVFVEEALWTCQDILGTAS